MQHLDEGVLQAWLDAERGGLGAAEIAAVEAHLATCDVCAARVSEIEQVTRRARSLLSSVVPLDREPPDYQVVVERAQAAGYRRAKPRRWAVPAWAASVVLALGVGWMGNELWRARPTVTDPSLDGAAQRAPAIAPPETPVEAEPSREVAASPTVPPTVVEPEPAGPVSPVPVQPATPVAERTVAPPPPAVLDAPSATGTPSYSVIRGRVVDAESGAPLVATQVFIPDQDIGVLAGADGTFTLRLPGADSSSVREVTLVAQRIGYGQAEQGVRVRGGDSVAADFSLREQVLQLDEIVVTGSPAATQRRALGNTVSVAPSASGASLPGATLEGVGAWAPRGRAAAEAGAGFELLLVPDLPVRSIETGALGDQQVVRVLQDLGDGAVLTLFQGTADLAIEHVRPLERESVASVRRGPVRVVASALLGTDSLNALLERLR